MGGDDVYGNLSYAHEKSQSSWRCTTNRELGLYASPKNIFMKERQLICYLLDSDVLAHRGDPSRFDGHAIRLYNPYAWCED